MPGSRRVKLIPRQNLLKIKIWDLQTPYNDALYSVSLDPSMAYPKIVEPNRELIIDPFVGKQQGGSLNG